MEPKTYAGRRIIVDENGCLVHYWDWTFEIGECISLELGVHLTPDLWQIVNLAREDFVRSGKSPSLEDILVHCDIDRELLEALFPVAPQTAIARIAGIPRLSDE